MREDGIAQSSYYDSLTGLPGMGYFLELVDAKRQDLAHAGGRMAILFVNLSGLRLHNRRYGYVEGNQLICQVAGVLKARFQNGICGYLGQGCFGVATTTEGLDKTLELVLDDCRALNEGKNRPLHIGVCVEEDADVEAGLALDHARTACKTCDNVQSSMICYFTTDMVQAEDEHQYIVDNLDVALKEGWVQIYCQPIVRTTNGKVCEEEALARWIDPEKGLLSPARFIPALEEAKLIYKLDLHVLELVLQKMTILRQNGLYIVPSSINFSRSDFEMCDMVEEIRRRVDEAGVDRRLITIEITESTLANDLEYMKEQVRRFHELGFSVWMDDFGSEYSSLDNLQFIPFDLIKLDMSFMRGFNKNQKNKIILTELVRMAIALGVDTVAEGVETQEQVDFLREIGCSKLQGFFFSKPNSLPEILKRYETGTAIGFENPAESEYFSALGKINLYDLESVARSERESFSHYFDTLPMAVIESDSTRCIINRCNDTYRDFLSRIADERAINQWVDYPTDDDESNGFIRALQKCATEGGLVVVDERLANGVNVHALVRHVAANPITGMAALAVAVLSIVDEAEHGEGVSFALMARALAADYINLYYVDLATDNYIEYSSDANVGEMRVVRKGEDFFGQSKMEALVHVFEDDQAAFLEAFEKQGVVQALDEHGAFNTTYRLAEKTDPVYVSMKALRIPGDNRHVMFGVYNVDAYMRQR